MRTFARHVIGAMIVTQLEPTRHAGRDGAEAPMHPLTDRLADNNSLSMVISPTLDFSRAISSSRSSRSRSFRADATPASARSRHSVSLATETFASRATASNAFATQQTRHHRHLALDRIALRSCIDARGGACASYGGALRRPLGLQPCTNRHFRNLRLRFNYRSQMSQLTVTHPTAEEQERSYRREAMEQALQTKESFDLYGLHFDSDKATI